LAAEVVVRADQVVLVVDQAVEAELAEQVGPAEALLDHKVIVI
jgi:hypothetical protein